MNIGIIYTGGTIGCVGSPLAPLSAAGFEAAFNGTVLPLIEQQYPGIAVTFLAITFPESATGTLDSTNLQPSDWCLMAQTILGNYGACDGFIVLHGTDSMDFTAPALSFLLAGFDAAGYPTVALSKPVIVTGSQLPLFYQSGGATALNFNTDALQNVCGAFAAAQSGVPEVCVYFQNFLYRGNRAVKTNASEFNAFSSPNFAPLGEYGVVFEVDYADVLPVPSTATLDDPAGLAAQLAQVQSLLALIGDYPVVQFNAFPASYSPGQGTAVMAGLITALVGQGIQGLILESYGEGNFPSGNPDNPSQGATYLALQSANNAGVVLVDCTQVVTAVVNDSAYAAGAWLPAVGALSPADMTPMAAQAKLTILLTLANLNGWPLPTVKTLLQTNLAGEMSSVNRLIPCGTMALGAGQAISALDGSASLRNDPADGLCLVASDGSVLWTPAYAQPLSAADLPGRLVLGADGQLAYYGRTGTALWLASAGANTASALSLDGSYADGSLVLRLVNYSTGGTTQLYPG